MRTGEAVGRVVGRLEDFPDGRPRAVDVDGRSIVVVRLGDAVYALDDACTHQGYSLAAGHVYRDTLEIECMRHGSCFSLCTGAPDAPPARTGVVVHDAAVDGAGQVLVVLAESGRPSPPAAASVAETYDSFAPYYDLWTSISVNATDHEAYYAGLAAERVPGGVAVELGVGTGRVAVEVARTGVHVIGMDGSQAMLARAADAAAAAGVADRLTLVEGRFETWAPDEPVRLVYCPYRTLGHVTGFEDRLALLAHVAEYVEPGGWFCFDMKYPDLNAMREFDGVERHFDPIDVDGAVALVSRVVHCDWDRQVEVQQVRGRLVVDGQTVLEQGWTFEIGWWFPDDVERGAAAAGFEVEWLSDGFGAEPVPPAENQVWRLRRR